MDKRKHPRRPAELDIELNYPSGENIFVKTRDISEGGLFLVLDDRDKPMMGEVIGVKLVGESARRETLPSAEAVVVHQAEDGIGVAFIVMEFQKNY